jgi:ABC-2 type transport system ATP-binding protein
MASDDPALELSSLAAGYHGRPVVEDIDFVVRRGEVLGLLGANGSGKSTLLKAVTGLLRPLAGRVVIDGIDLAQAPERAKARFGFAIDPADLPESLSGRQYLELVASLRGCDADDASVTGSLERLELAPWLTRPIAEYSLGTRGKLSIVAALVGLPPLLILDESLNGLDPVAAFKVKAMLRELAASGRHAVIVSTHVVETVPALCTTAVLLADGRLAARWESADLHEIAKSPGGFEAEVMAMLRASPPERRQTNAA